MRRREMLLVLGSGLGARTWAQDATFATAVNVVSVLASVRDKQGHYVRDLGQDDFELREDGRLQQIKYFSRQTDAALTLGMLVDTSLSQRRVLDEERNAGREFLWQVLRPAKDSAFLVRFDVEVELTQDSTNSLPKLDKALNSLEVPRSRAGRGRGGVAGIGTLLYDAVFLAADEVLKKLEGRKAIILLSDGDDHGSRVSLARAVETTQKADTSVYAIHIFDENGGLARGFGGRQRRRAPARRRESIGQKALLKIAEETGGRYFEVTGQKPLDQVYREIEEELRNQYSLGYVSDRPVPSAEFRKIAIVTKRKGLTVQARNGYYAR